jgi:hypothetical protein
MRWLILPWAMLAASCSIFKHQPQLILGDPSAPSQVTPAEAIAIAQKLSTYPWRASPNNILHGKDKSGIIVQTPDISLLPQDKHKGWWVPDTINAGIPYKWGGYDDPQSFVAATAIGYAAGDISSPEKRRADNAGISKYAAGLDCSGFVSKCLKLPTIHDTRQLLEVCDTLPDTSHLRAGDIMNIPRVHAILFAGWANPERTWIYFYETGGAPDYWKPGIKKAPLKAMEKRGFQPLRYKGMAQLANEADTLIIPTLTKSVRENAPITNGTTMGEL